MKTSYYLQFGVFLLFLCSCKKDTPDPASNTDQSSFDQVNISNAVGFYSKSTSHVDPTAQIYKVLADGSSQPVQFYRKGSEYPHATIYKLMYDFNEDYMLMISNFAGLMVRKSDGNVKEFSGLDLTAARFQKSGSNTLYYLMYEKVMKISNPSIDVVNVEQVSLEGDNVSDFVVDSKGNVLYYGYSSNPMSHVFKLKRANGTYENVPRYSDKILASVWLGQDDNFYFNYLWSGVVSRLSDVKRIALNPLDTLSYYSGTNVSYFGPYGWMSAIKSKSKILASFNPLDCHECAEYEFTEIYNNSAQPNSFEISDYSITTLRYYTTSDNYLYLAGVSGGINKILRIDTDTKAATSVLDENDYKVSFMRIDSDENVWFVAEKLSNGTSVMGRIDHASGNIKITDENMSQYYSESLMLLH